MARFTYVKGRVALCILSVDVNTFANELTNERQSPIACCFPDIGHFRTKKNQKRNTLRLRNSELRPLTRLGIFHRGMAQYDPDEYILYLVTELLNTFSRKKNFTSRLQQAAAAVRKRLIAIEPHSHLCLTTTTTTITTTTTASLRSPRRQWHHQGRRQRQQ